MSSNTRGLTLDSLKMPYSTTKPRILYKTSRKARLTNSASDTIFTISRRNQYIAISYEKIKLFTAQNKSSSHDNRVSLFVDKSVLKKLFGRPTFLRITRKATSEKVLADNGGAGRQLVNGRMVRGDLKDGGHPLELVPGRMARQHFDDGAAQTPGKKYNKLSHPTGD